MLRPYWKISFFILFKILAYHNFHLFVGPDSSLFESRMRGGKELGDSDRLPFVVTIYTRNPLTMIYGMGSFYNGQNVITSKYCAETIKGNEENYYVKGGKRVGYQEFNISRVKYTSDDKSNLSSSYGILKVSYEIYIILIE